MIETIHIKKTTSLPEGPWPPNTLYYEPVVGDGSNTKMTLAVSSSDGSTLYKGMNHPITRGGGYSLVVSDYESMTSMSLGIDLFIWVEDASGDPAVDSGPALYIHTTKTHAYINMSGDQVGGQLTTGEW